ncbi:MAG TPA: M28 family peptidase [Flavisolibacter sp.]|jgi:hypothetical protein|nr:M28 family peptidase [Flavisolibacter sp.]
MKKTFVFFAIIANVAACAQAGKNGIDVKEVQRIESTLASDEMKGRRVGTPEMDKAASFIADEFKKAGLVPVSGNGFLQEFFMVRPKFVSIKGEVNDQELDPKNIIAVTLEAELKVDEKSGYAIEYVTAGQDLRARSSEIMKAQKNTVAFFDTSFAKSFSRLVNYKRAGFKSATSANVIFVLGNYQPATFKFKAEHTLEQIRFANVVGMLPGKTKKDEFVVFSGHYDHLGIGKPVGTDSIFNGANDDAAGTTAVITLASYFKKLNNNERTIIFAAFTAEEVGGFGSQYFSRQLEPAKVMAMFNIEMIGTESKWGKNSAYITGYEKTNMGDILQKNLQGTAFTFHPDPYTTQNLFYRSDNATLARLGVPAHTISTSKMDDEPNYHKVSDEVSTLDLENMAQIIKAIAESSRSIISGKDTPSRVKPEDLN